jgi:hypothetical protein
MSAVSRVARILGPAFVAATPPTWPSSSARRSAARWMANTPPQVSADPLNVPRSMIEALPKEKRSVVPGSR